jgi:hypothetical protein
MNLKGQRQSTNFVDETSPTGLTALRNAVGEFLYTHGITNGAGGRPYDPNVPIGTPYGGNAPSVPVDAQGRRADIDWDSNKRLPMMAADTHQSNDKFARSHGFKDAATMAAYWRHQQQMRAGGDAPSQPLSRQEWFKQLFAVHPMVLLQHVADKIGDATGN